MACQIQPRRAPHPAFRRGLSFVALLATAALPACRVRCENQIQQQLPSPDHRFQAILFSRECGATTRQNSQISILSEKTKLPDDGANVFISDRQDLTLYWSGENTLHIVRDPAVRAYKSEPRVGGVAVVYESVNAARGSVEGSLAVALEAANPYVKEGFTVREDYWGGELPTKESKAIVHSLFKGNDYWFWIGSDAAAAPAISVHVYDSDGKLAEIEAWQHPSMAAAHVVPKRTGAYYLIIEIEKAETPHSHWALTYGFR